jgi:hypothetical protein
MRAASEMNETLAQQTFRDRASVRGAHDALDLVEREALIADRQERLILCEID